MLVNRRATIQNNLAANRVPRGQVCQIWDKRHGSRKSRIAVASPATAFAAFMGRSPDTATAEDLRRFQLHQKQTGMQPPSINSAVAALRFLP
jgi:hypothetical protein